MNTLLMNDTFTFDIGTNDMDENVDTPKIGFMCDNTDIFDFFKNGLNDDEQLDFTDFFTDMAVDMDPFDYMKPIEINIDDFGK